MQNLVDSLAQHFQEAVPEERHEQLNTFVVYNQRSRVTSSAKRKRQPGSLKIHQTPDGSFLDLMRNGRDLLLRCGFHVPQVLGLYAFCNAHRSFLNDLTVMGSLLTVATPVLLTIVALLWQVNSLRSTSSKQRCEILLPMFALSLFAAYQ